LLYYKAKKKNTELNNPVFSRAAGLEAGLGGEDGEEDSFDHGLKGSAASLSGKGFLESRKMED